MSPGCAVPTNRIQAFSIASLLAAASVRSTISAAPARPSAAAISLASLTAPFRSLERPI